MAGPREVAARAGVSTVTVARVLSGTAPVSEALATRVREAIAEVRYVPNQVASSLSRGRTSTLGLLVSDIANPSQAQVARGVEDEAAKQGYRVLIGSSDFEADREARLLTSFAARSVDAAALVSSGELTPALEQLVQRDLPLAFIDRRPADPARGPLISSDNAGTARQAVGYLVELGHRDIAMVSGPTRLPTVAQRIAGFRSGCEAAGIPNAGDRVVSAKPGAAGGYCATKALLDSEWSPTAIITSNNLFAVGALQAAREAGLRIPEGVSLLALDDMDLFPFVDPPLTAFVQPSYTIGVQAARALLNELAGHGRGKDATLIPAEFRERASCARGRAPCRRSRRTRRP